MKVTSYIPPDDAPQIRVMNIIEFDPWPFAPQSIGLKESLGTVFPDKRTVAFSHMQRTLDAETWSVLVTFDDGRSARAEPDHGLRVGDLLAVRED